ncbi:hypothetical protein [Brachybacterium squillarum]|uniref:hypothetical protein n=1 Tax=Brachybacterium squillarum TaxID=661979 RepID=UPI000262962A|nr:hypothetical protein [Brachybacterium squillarum]
MLGTLSPSSGLTVISRAIRSSTRATSSTSPVDAYLIERALPEPDRTGAPGEATLMVAKRYRSARHSSFHRSAAYTEGRRVKDFREARAADPR